MITVNTKYESAGRVVLEDALKGIKCARNDRDYTKYDTVIFMAPDSEVKFAKKINPAIKCIIFDPKTNNLEDVRLADELIVSSIEQREFFLKYNKNIQIYYMFPPVYRYNNQKGQTIFIGYHGNKQHLEEMTELTKALDDLAVDYDIALIASYNINKLGMWKKNRPKICKVLDRQWSSEYYELNPSCIGVCPSLKPTWKLTDDYVSRYKYSNNPGRIWVFSQLGIPVIADFTPSSCQFIKDGHNGLLVGSKEGWKRAIEMLFDPKLRNKLANNLRKDMEKYKKQKLL